MTLAGDELRSFCARILGWSNDRAVEHALRSLRSIELAADPSLPKYLWGWGYARTHDALGSAADLGRTCSSLE